MSMLLSVANLLVVVVDLDSANLAVVVHVLALSNQIILVDVDHVVSCSCS
jgi:hypothetical protein